MINGAVVIPETKNCGEAWGPTILNALPCRCLQACLQQVTVNGGVQAQEGLTLALFDRLTVLFRSAPSTKGARECGETDVEGCRRQSFGIRVDQDVMVPLIERLTMLMSTAACLLARDCQSGDYTK